jgi:anti-sigma-K factor RskA
MVASRPAVARSSVPALERAPLRSSLGWYVAAAAILLAAAAWWPSLREVVDPSSPERELARFESRALDRVAGEWKAMAELEGREVSGRCEWSDAEQRGFLVFSGLPRNAPDSEQYQLWIIVRDQEHPIDGGVFDALAAEGGGGDLVVPVTAKLPVSGPTAFAVTIEKKGGVVVSDRSRLVLLASLAR